MDQVIIYNVEISENCPSGTCIEVPTGEITIEEVLERIDPKAVNVHIKNRDEILEDRYFRNAWSIKENNLVVDMGKAKDVHINKLREIRNKKLQSLDAEYMKALEIHDNDAVSKFVELKNKLRDMPIDSIFDLPLTPDELKNTVPEYLK